MKLVARRIGKLWIRGALLCVLLAMAPLPAYAASADVKKAAEAFDRGREAFRAESYVEAAEHFEAADDYSSSPAALRLAITARKEAGQLERALTLAALALASYPGDPDVTAEAQALVSEHAPEFGRVDVSCDEECELLLDGKLVHGPRAFGRTLYVAPGRHRLQASWSESRTSEQSLAVAAGDVTSTRFEAPPLPESDTAPVAQAGLAASDAAPAAEERHGLPRGIFWTGTALTLIGTGVSIGLGVNATQNPGRQAVIDNCAPGDTTCPEFQAGLANQTAANVAVGVTVGLGVLTIVTAFFTDWGGKKAPRDEDRNEGWSVTPGGIRIRPAVGLGGGATLGAVGTF